MHARTCGKEGVATQYRGLGEALEKTDVSLKETAKVKTKEE